MGCAWCQKRQKLGIRFTSRTGSAAVASVTNTVDANNQNAAIEEAIRPPCKGILLLSLIPPVSAHSLTATLASARCELSSIATWTYSQPALPNGPLRSPVMRCPIRVIVLARLQAG